MKRHLILLSPLLISAGSLSNSEPAADLVWRADYRETLELAEAEGKVVFVAVNMDGERANDKMAEETYGHKVIVSLSARTLNLIASSFEHKNAGVCPRFGSITCAQHKSVDIRVRENVLKPDANDYVIAPQHVFLAPDGKVLLSVPYVVSAEELEWCFVKALKMVDPKSDVKASSKARAPKRLLMEGVVDTAASGEKGTTPASPATREQVLELIREIKKGKKAGRQDKLRRIMTADEPEALDYIGLNLRSIKSKPHEPGKRRRKMIGDIGRLSPQSYWELLAEFTGDPREDTRAAIAAALEQLASPDAIKCLKAALRKEKVPALEGNWLRAMASSAPADKNLRKDLIKNSSKASEAIVRVQSIVALGYLIGGEDVTDAITSAFENGDPEIVRAAACAMAISRDSTWIEPLQAKLEGLPPGELNETITASLEVLSQGRLESLCGSLMDVCEDSIARPRFYGPAPREKP